MQMVMIKHGAGAEMAKARLEKWPIPFFFQGEKLFTFLRTSPSPLPDCFVRAPSSGSFIFCTNGQRTGSNHNVTFIIGAQAPIEAENLSGGLRTSEY